MDRVIELRTRVSAVLAGKAIGSLCRSTRAKDRGLSSGSSITRP